MPNPATVQDVADRWRPLTDAETVVAETLLGDAWRMLKRAMSKRAVDLEVEMSEDSELSGEVVRVLAVAVLRVLKNPDGNSQESLDDHAWTRGQDTASGVLFFPDEDLESLFPGSGEKGRAFTIDPLADYAERLA